MQSFLGKINFLRKFIFDYSQVVKPMQEMVRKDVIYKWEKMEKDVISLIKQEITKAPALYNPYFKNYFLLYTFASNTSPVTILILKDDHNNEWVYIFYECQIIRT